MVEEFTKGARLLGSSSAKSQSSLTTPNQRKEKEGKKLTPATHQPHQKSDTKTDPQPKSNRPKSDNPDPYWASSKAW